MLRQGNWGLYTLRPHKTRALKLYPGPTIPLWVRLGILLARGVILRPARGVGSRTIRLPMRARRLHIAGTGTISRMTRNIFVILPWLFCWTTSHHVNVSSSLQYLVQPSHKRFHVFEAASIVDESSTTYKRLSRTIKSAVCCRILSSIRRISWRLPPSRRLSRRQGWSSI